MNFVEVTYRNVGEGLFNRSRNDSKTAASPKTGPAWVTAHKAENVEHIAQPCRQLNTLEYLSRQLCWSESLLGTLLPSASRELGLSESVSRQSLGRGMGA